jgi:hypothetical protein
MGWLGSVLDKVGNILGGDKTYSVKKDTDGNISVSEDPSTRGEKWGRVAAAALTGAGVGLANSTGVNAPARAAAAGFQAGTQLPGQQKQQAQQDATFEQQTQMRNAQKALTQQQIAQNAFNMQQKGIALTDAQVDRSNAIQDWIGSNKVNQDLGTFKNMDEAMKMAKMNPDALGNHANGKLHFAQEADGKVHVWNMDQAWLDQKNDKDVTFKELVPGNTPDAPMQFKDHVIPAGSMTNAQIEQAEEGNTNRIAKYQTDVAGLQEKATAAAAATAERGQAAAEATAERAQAAREAAAARAEQRNQAGATRQDTRDFQMQQKGRGLLDKAEGQYRMAQQSANTVRDMVGMADRGNKMGAQMLPLEGALEVTTSQGVKRINRSEIDQYAGGGSMFDRIAGEVGKLAKGQPIPANIRQDIRQLADVQEAAAYNNYRNAHTSAVQRYNLQDEQPLEAPSAWHAPGINQGGMQQPPPDPGPAPTGMKHIWAPGSPTWKVVPANQVPTGINGLQVK